MGFVPKDKEGYLNRILSFDHQLDGPAKKFLPLLRLLAMLEYFPKKELKNLFSIDSLGELDIEMESKYYALM